MSRIRKPLALLFTHGSATRAIRGTNYALTTVMYRSWNDRKDRIQIGITERKQIENRSKTEGKV